MDLAPGFELDPAVPVDALEPHPDNPNAGDVDAIGESIDRLGFYGVVTAQRRPGGRGRILAGEHRWRAAIDRGAATVPVCWVEVDDVDALALLMGDNLLARRAVLDAQRSAQVLLDLQATDAGLLGTGISDDDLAALVARFDSAPPAMDPADPAGSGPAGTPAAPTPPADPISRRGDVWLIGPHRLMVGDCRLADDVDRLMAGAAVDLAITSPPYADRREYDDRSGFRPIHPDAYVEWFAPVAANVAAHLAERGNWFVNIKAGADGADTWLYVLDLVLAHARAWGWHYVTEFCWERTGVPKSVRRRFKNQFEPVHQFSRSDLPAIYPDAVRHLSDSAVEPIGAGAGDTGWQDAQGQGGDLFARNREAAAARDAGRQFTNAEMQGEPGFEWFDGRRGDGLAYPGNRLPTYNVRPVGTGLPDWFLDAFADVLPDLLLPGNRLPSFAGSHEATGHSAAFPVGLPAWFIRAYTEPGDVVYDPFAGSASTILAADELAREAYGMEVSAGYVDAALARLERHTGIVPVLEATGVERSFLEDP